MTRIDFRLRRYDSILLSKERLMQRARDRQMDEQDCLDMVQIYAYILLLESSAREMLELEQTVKSLQETVDQMKQSLKMTEVRGDA